eukprot:3662781-Alexandrium_andersonii.AAC.1
MFEACMGSHMSGIPGSSQSEADAMQRALVQGVQSGTVVDQACARHLLTHERGSHVGDEQQRELSLIHISEPTRLALI